MQSVFCAAARRRTVRTLAGRRGAAMVGKRRIGLNRYTSLELWGLNAEGGGQHARTSRTRCRMERG